MQDLLAEILAGDEIDLGIGRVLEPFDDAPAISDAPVLERAAHVVELVGHPAHMIAHGEPEEPSAHEPQELQVASFMVDGNDLTGALNTEFNAPDTGADGE